MSHLQGTNGFEDRARFPLPNVALLDIRMPKADGFDVLKWMRQQQKFDCTIAVMLASSDEPKDIRKAFELRANSYIQKSSCMDLKDFARVFSSYGMEINVCPRGPVEASR